MKVSVILAGLTALAAAHPTSKAVAKREQPYKSAINDGVVLNYALTLEHLESAFYREALSKFKAADFAAAGYDATFYNNIQEVSYDEDTHVTFLTGALKAAGVTPATECKYSFPYTDVKGFLSLAAVLEGVGVSAYLGAAEFIANKAYLTAAATILTVEARHAAYIRNSVALSPFPAPFDTPLDFSNVYSLAAAFITSCPGNPVTLPFKAFPALKVAPSQYNYRPGSRITFLTSGLTIPSGKKLYAVFFIQGGPVYVRAYNTHKDQYKAKVPKEATGQTYIVLQANNKKVDDSTIIAGPALVEVRKPGVE